MKTAMKKPSSLALDTKAIVVKATVRLTEKDGQGVLVPGGLVVTAAHLMSDNYFCRSCCLTN